MFKYLKIFKKVIPIVLVIVLLSNAVIGVNVAMPATGEGVTAIDGMTQAVWNTIRVVLQILAIAAILIAGIRYMFASANEKADIKKQTLVLVVGALLVFAAVQIAEFISALVASIL